MSNTALVDTSDANPFASGALQRAQAPAEASQSREIAEVQAAMVIAKRFPRDPIAAMDRILQACTRPTLAEGALYSYARGGTDITGPSIRLAEVCAQAWGNVQFGVREVEQREGESTVEAFAWDIETNTRQVKTFHVEHKRHTKSGSYKLTDPRDIYETVANNGARRLRACILGIIPGDVIEAAVKECERTLKASADTTPEGLKKLAVAFEQFSVTQAMIEKRCQCRLEAIRPAQVVQLKKVWASLRDGMSTPADWFEGAAEATVSASTEELAEKLVKRTKPADAAPPANMDADTGEIPAPDAKPQHAKFLARLHLAESTDELDAIADEARAELPDGPERDEVFLLHDRRSLELS